MKFLIILIYCDRPNMVRFALDSIKAQTYGNFEVAAIDDSVEYPLWNTVLKDSDYFIPGVVYTVGDPIEKKIETGSRFGMWINTAIAESDADVALMLCDDDALHTNTLEGLNRFYIENPDVAYSYGHVLTYDPYQTKNYASIKGRLGSSLNNYTDPINAFCKVDASQVSWRLEPYKEAEITFPYPQTAALDAAVYQQMYDKLGPCVFNGQFVQFKGIFSDQLGSRTDMYRPVDKEFYDTAV